MGYSYSSALENNMITTTQLKSLLSKKVELVCFAQYSAYIHIEGGALLTVEAGFELAPGGSGQYQQYAFPILESNLMRILECAVTIAEVGATGDLRLRFSNGDALHISEQPEFESYCVRIGDQEFRP
jgi:hypothetical protein